MKEYIDISGLLPAISSLWPWPGFGYINSEHLSALFVVVMLTILSIFIIYVVWSNRKISKRIKVLNGKIEDSDFKKGSKNEKLLINHLWREFGDTFVNGQIN